MSAIDALIWDQPTEYGATTSWRREMDIPSAARNLAGGTDGSPCTNDAHTRDLDADLAVTSKRDQCVITDAVTSTNDIPSGYQIRRSEANDHHHPPQTGA